MNANTYPGAAENEAGVLCMEDNDNDGWGDSNPVAGVTPGLDCDDEANNDKVIEEMRDVSAQKRTCRFRCVLALVGDNLEETFAGACEGTLLFERKGTGGFGYDPLFQPNESDSTFAEISLDEKAKISHRARALHLLIDWISRQ